MKSNFKLKYIFNNINLIEICISCSFEKYNYLYFKSEN